MGGMDTKGLSGAEAFLRVLREMGVEWIFASPGSEWAPIWEHLAKPYRSDKEIPAYLSTRHEEIAVPMEFLIEIVSTNPPAVASYAVAPAAETHAIDELARVLADAANPVIITEKAGRSVRAVEHLVALAELLGAPVVETWHPEYVNF